MVFGPESASGRVVANPGTFAILHSSQLKPIEPPRVIRWDLTKELRPEEMWNIPAKDLAQLSKPESPFYPACIEKFREIAGAPGKFPALTLASIKQVHVIARALAHHHLLTEARPLVEHVEKSIPDLVGEAEAIARVLIGRFDASLGNFSDAEHSFRLACRAWPSASDATLSLSRLVAARAFFRLNSNEQVPYIDLSEMRRCVVQLFRQGSDNATTIQLVAHLLSALSSSSPSERYYRHRLHEFSCNLQAVASTERNRGRTAHLLRLYTLPLLAEVNSKSCVFLWHERSQTRQDIYHFSKNETQAGFPVSTPEFNYLTRLVTLIKTHFDTTQAPTEGCNSLLAELKADGLVACEEMFLRLEGAHFAPLRRPQAMSGSADKAWVADLPRRAQE